ncbi:hypothetical protein [Paenibacillus massiliensis]|uniref:hypothetical protein n=1 Tax=Paenibacillus massiliensis TaxID=225917 RepID=UPI000472DE2E|nr:hypothetical protein [Paenibacillus massiliensis]
MGTAISIIICLVFLLNLILVIREGQDERWKQITSRPLNYAFTLLTMGYTCMVLADSVFELSYETYKAAFNYIFAGVLLIYIVVLILERRKFS